MDKLQDASVALCRHCRTLIECEYCQILAFLSVNRYDVGLPYMIKDVAGLILKRLTTLYDEQFLQRVIEQQQRDELLYQHRMELSGNDGIKVRPLHIGNLSLRQTTVNVQKKKYADAAHDKMVAEKLKARAQQQERRRCK